jgi:hypothetical protein
MMKNEFEALVGKEVSEDDYRNIEYVYAFHPSISEVEGKKQIAAIYQLPGGMRIIRDMLLTADQQARLEEEKAKMCGEIRRIEELIASIDRQMEELKA